MAASKIVSLKKTGRNLKRLHAMRVCLSNEVVTAGARNVLPELPNTYETHTLGCKMIETTI